MVDTHVVVGIGGVAELDGLAQAGFEDELGVDDDKLCCLLGLLWGSLLGDRGLISLDVNVLQNLSVVVVAVVVAHLLLENTRVDGLGGSLVWGIRDVPEWWTSVVCCTLHG